MKGSVRRDMEQSLMAVMPKDKPGVFNEAWMELGEVVCIPGGTPLCDKCPLRFGCKACEQETWMEIPVKPPKKQRKIEKKTVLLLQPWVKDCHPSKRKQRTVSRHVGTAFSGRT